MIEPETRGERWALHFAERARRDSWATAVFCIFGVVWVFLGLFLGLAPGRSKWDSGNAALWFIVAYVWYERRQFARLLERQSWQIEVLTKKLESGAEGAGRVGEAHASDGRRDG